MQPMADCLQKVTVLAEITVDLSVPELQTKRQLSEWIESKVARTHFIDHLRPESFRRLEVVKVATTTQIIG